VALEREDGRDGRQGSPRVGELGHVGPPEALGAAFSLAAWRSEARDT
jgi:hypothetical protein